MKNLYSHPAINFYRTIETDCIKRVMKNIRIKSPSLDLGCGDGKITNYLFGKTFDYGLDNDEVGDVKTAKKNKIYKKILIEDATNTSLKDNSVNFVFSNSVLEHIPDLEKVLSEGSRILNKNGYLLISVPTDKFKKHLFFKNPIYLYLRNKMLHHHHLYSHKKWISILKKHSLKVVKHEYCVTPAELTHWDFLAIVNKSSVIARGLAPWQSLYSNTKITKSQNNKIISGCNLVLLAKKI